MKPAFSYYGGKQKIVSKIIPHIPQHTVYAEPFCGGATLLFKKPDLRTGNSNHYREAINDINSDVYNFFCVLRDNPEDLIERLQHMPYSQEEHRNAKSYKGDDKLLRAYYFFVNISQSFASELNSGWRTGKVALSQNHSYSYRKSLKRLEQCAERLRQVYLSNEDAIRFIKRWDSPQTFFYCDPPYPEAHQGHYGGYTQEDFECLLSCLDECKGSFILSCYENVAVPKEWEKMEIETVCSSSNTKNGGHRDKRVECIWIRQAKEEPRKEIVKIYEKQRQMQMLNTYS